MPLVYEISDEQKLVVVKATGVLTPEDVSIYKHEVWTSERVSGYDEIFDLSEVQSFEYKTPGDVRGIAQLASSMDWISLARRLAIVATTDVGFGLGRMYQAYRESDPASRIEVQVFRTLEQARIWLGK